MEEQIKETFKILGIAFDNDIDQMDIHALRIAYRDAMKVIYGLVIGTVLQTKKK